MFRSWLACVFVLTLGQIIKANPINTKGPMALELIILHNNDMHARFEQTNVNSGRCLEEDANTNNCYGGFARVAYEVRKFRTAAQNGGTPVLYLNAGDTYTGTPWFTLFKDNITAAFLNKLKPDAISLGNHEFDENVEGLIPLLNNVNFPVLVCNLDLRNVPELAATKHLAKSTVLTVKGTKIGVIGYLTPDTKHLVFKNKVEYNEEIVSINAEAKKLKAQGINIIIALGHSGYLKDQEIAKHCPDVDIVIGGHSHSFLYGNKTIPSDQHNTNPEAIRGPYPTMVNRGGTIVPVVQAYAFTKYLGKLHVGFDANGNLVEFDGSPILLNAKVAQESDVLELLEVYRPNITALDTEILGFTKVDLMGNAELCRYTECNMGNLIADSMVYARALEYQGGKYWTDAPIALLQGGGVRSSILKNSKGTLTGTDILTVLPFGNYLFTTRISGQKLRQALEHSAAVRDKDSNGGFLQVSGIHVKFDDLRPEGHRIVSVQVRCAECKVPSYSDLDDTASYNVIVSQFILEGGDGHVVTEEPPITVRLQNNDQGALRQYLLHHQVIYPEVEGRIVFNGSLKIMGSITIILLSSIVMQIFSCNYF